MVSDHPHSAELWMDESCMPVNQCFIKLRQENSRTGRFCEFIDRRTVEWEGVGEFLEEDIPCIAPPSHHRCVGGEVNRSPPMTSSERMNPADVCSSSSRMEAVWVAVLPYQRSLAGSMAGLNMVDGLRPSSFRRIVDG